MQSLRFYVDHNWYTSLSTNQIIYFIEILYDIWIYRAQLNTQTKTDICFPTGNPFVGICMRNIRSFQNKSQLHPYVIKIMNDMINTGITDAYRNMGALYVLIALSTVNKRVIESMPWIEYAL